MMKAARVPGLSIALVIDAQLAWMQAFGVRSAASKAPVRTDTLFEAGSISKTVFAYAVMKLHQEGVLDVDTPLTRYEPERWVDDERFDQITARHVLSHTSGLQNWRSTADPLRIHFNPGTQWLYSGEAYSYLQLVVARRTGKVSSDACETLYDGIRVCETDMDAYLKRTLLRPLGMPSSGYVWDAALADRTALPHDQAGAELSRPRTTPRLAARFGAAGGLSTTPSEYARFLIEVLRPTTGDAIGLSAASRDEMIRPHVKVDDSSSWALGWQVLHRSTGDLISHGGDNPGFQSFMLASPARQTGYIIMTNGDSGIEVIRRLASGVTPLNTIIGA